MGGGERGGKRLCLKRQRLWGQKEKNDGPERGCEVGGRMIEGALMGTRQWFGRQWFGR